MLDLVLKNGKVYLDGIFKQVAVGVKDGKIVMISEKMHGTPFRYLRLIRLP